jgi:hypothetical protein
MDEKEVIKEEQKEFKDYDEEPALRLSIPSHIVPINDDSHELLFLDLLNVKSDIKLYGKGAMSENMIELKMSCSSELDVRKWHKQLEGRFEEPTTNETNRGTVFKCYSSRILALFKPGDSGTWLWTYLENGSPIFVGMAFGYGSDDERGHQCVFLPWKLVRMAVESSIVNKINIER